jgi:peptidase C39-like protein/SdrD B-like protein
VPWPGTAAAQTTKAAPAPPPAPAAPAPGRQAPPPPLPTAEPTQAPTRVPTPSPTAEPTRVTTGAVHGLVFLDADANAAADSSEDGLAGIEVVLTSPRGTQRTIQTGADGQFAFEGLSAGTYHLQVQSPSDRVATTGTAIDVDVSPDGDVPVVWFGLSAVRSADAQADVDPSQLTADQIAADAQAEAASDADQEQLAAFTAVSSLPLRFAQGRDLMEQLRRRILGDGLVWLGVPFRSQIDGGLFQYVNCGPASLTMVLAGFGLEVGPSQVRDYLNQLIDNYDTDLGTSLDVLGRIGREAGLTPMDLYSDHGGYRNWSTDAVRWHLQQGHPVITLVKYRNLPGHGTSLSEFDHYIVISGLTPNGFIYNDAAFATTIGYGLEISDAELEVAWDNSSIPHHAIALGLSPDQKTLSFPEAPRRPAAPPRESAAARAARQQAQADEADRPPLVLTPQPLVLTPVPGVPLISVADRWESEEDFQATEPGGPMGMSLDRSTDPALEAQPGPGRAIPTLVGLILAAWLLLGVWSTSRRLARLTVRLPRVSPVRATLTALLSLLRH